MIESTLTAGSTNVSRVAVLQTTAGLAVTTAVYNTAGLIAYYVRDGAAPVQVALATQTPGGVWAAGGFCAIHTTRMPGAYRVDWPDAAFALGTGESVTLVVTGTGWRTWSETIALRVDEEVYGQVITGATTTSIPTTGFPTMTTGQSNRRLLQFLTGPCAGERTLIVGQTAGGVLQVAPPTTTAPTDGDRVVMR